jgi:hypothetical protein
VKRKGRLLSTALTQLKDQHYLTIAKLARTTKIPPGTLVRLMTGRHHPDAKNFEQLCQTLPKAQAARVLEAYLRDHIPEGLDHLVRLCAAPGGQTGDHNVVPDELPKEACGMSHELMIRSHDKLLFCDGPKCLATCGYSYT